MQALQLKIVLKDSRPPIWRRVLINPDATFWELHSVIQDVFGWENCHLHSFERAWKRNEDRHMIEVSRQDDLRDFIGGLHTAQGPQDYYYDERKEKLSSWLDEKHPTFWYTYDFGDNWEHVITFEKLVEVSNLKLARYMEGKRRGMQEDSRFESLLDCTLIIHAAEKPSSELWKAIVEDLGEAKAKKLVDRAQKEAASKAPARVSFYDPNERYKESKSMGMFD